MPHGKPDWGIDWSPRTVRGLEDLGEHAVRLGSPHLWDRRGDVIFQCDFAEGLQGLRWYEVPPGLVHELYAGNSMKGAFSVRGVCGPAAGEVVGVTKSIPFPVASRIGLEVAHNFAITFAYFTLEIHIITAAAEVSGAVRIDRVNNRLQYDDGTPGWANFGAAPNVYLSNEILHVMKLVIDATTGQYVRMILDDIEEDLRGIPLNPVGAGGMSHVIIEVYGENVAFPAAEVFIDNVIFTQNEP